MTATAAQAALPTARFDGATRYDVAVGVSQSYGPGVDVLYVAKGSDYPDALSAAPAAAALGGPLLLTAPGALPPTVRNEIARLQPDRVVVVGGAASISENVIVELQTLAPSVARVGGSDRYDASRSIVRDAFGQTGATRIYLATGANFPDALAASAVAGGRGGAVLLVNGSASQLDEATRDLIADLSPDDIVIAGGVNSVSSSIEEDAKSLGYPLQRLSGSDRYSAAVAINAEAFGSTPTSNAYLATGANFPDALTGAVLAGRDRAPLFLVRAECAPVEVVRQIGVVGATQVTAFGGRNSVSDASLNLEECRPFVNPTASVSYDCGSGLAFSVFNPNQAAVVVAVSVDTNGDGRLDGALTSASVAAGRSYVNYSAGSLRDRATTNVVLQVQGNTIFSTLITPACEQPPTASASYSCQSGLAFSVRNPNTSILSVEVAYDAGGDGVLDRSVLRVDVAGRSTYTNYSAGPLPEDSWVDVVFLRNGVSFAKSTVFVDCVPPAPTPTQQWAIRTFGHFDAVQQSGFGDAVIRLPAGARAGLVRATSNGSSNVAIWTLDADNERYDLLVNEIGYYSGTTAFGSLGWDQDAKSILIEASGSWSIEILPMASAPELTGSSSGDGVFLYPGLATSFTITHNGSSNFIVWEHTSNRFPNELIINEIGPYSGTVPFRSGPSVVTINADGAWTIRGN